MKSMQHLFVHFMNMEYIYDGANSDEIWHMMSVTDQKMFPFNVRLVDWTKCLHGF